MVGWEQRETKAGEKDADSRPWDSAAVVAFKLSVNHGEVPDPDQDQSERSTAYGQPLLSGCYGSGALFGAQTLGQSSWRTAAPPRPP